MTAFADQVRTSWDEAEDFAPRHYSDPQFSRSEAYRGPLERVTEEEALALFRELLEYFRVQGLGNFPMPPYGLPGLNRRYEHSTPPEALLRLGRDYFIAAIRGEGRAMHNRWQDAETMLRKVADEAREELIEEMCQRDLQRALEQSRRREEKPQLVYFIGSESGPIKIGIAANPKGRCKDLQTSHHERLSVLATRAGGQSQERMYHNLFAAHRLNGEWFRRCPEIEAEIERLKASPNPSRTPPNVKEDG